MNVGYVIFEVSHFVSEIEIKESIRKINIIFVLYCNSIIQRELRYVCAALYFDCKYDTFVIEVRLSMVRSEEKDSRELKKLLKEFLIQFCTTEITALEYLRKNHVLQYHAKCSKIFDNKEICRRFMKEMMKKCKNSQIRKPKWKFTRKKCRSTRYARASNPFFFYEDGNGRINVKVSLRKVLEIIFLRLKVRITSAKMISMTRVSKGAVIDWVNLCLQTCG